MVIYGELGLIRILIFGMMLGFQIVIIGKLSLPKGVIYYRAWDSIYLVPNNWDEDLVRQTLRPIDAHIVLAIPLPQHDC